MEEKKGLVSIILNCYNGEKYLQAAINTVIHQSYSNWELIFWDNRSSDNSKKIFDSNRSDKLKYFLSKTHTSLYEARKFALKECNGEYIAFLDDDDIWFATKLEKQLSAMNQNNCEMSSTEGLIGNKRERYNKDKKYKRYLGQNFFNHLQKIYKNHNIDLKNGFPKIWDQNFIKIHNCMITSSVIIKKEILEKVNYMDNRPYGEDWFCWKKCLEYTKSVYLDDDVYFYYA